MIHDLTVLICDMAVYASVALAFLLSVGAVAYCFNPGRKPEGF